VNQSARAFYDVGPLGECPHAKTRLECDLRVSRRFVSCADCGAAGPTADSDQAALEGWAELVEFVEALVVWNERNADVRTTSTPPELAPLEASL